MSDADRAAADAWMRYMDRVHAGEITLAEANALADNDPVTRAAERVAGDLRRHSLAWRMRGFPVYDDPEDEDPSGYVRASPWEWSTLTAEQQATVRTMVDELIASGASEDAAWGWACDQHGVTCNHRWERPDPAYRTCSRCLVTEFLPGVVVTFSDGERRLVPDPPPAVWRLPRKVALSAVAYASDAPVSATLDVDEYHWTGSSYQLAPR